jgi:hypothetical protein
MTHRRRASILIAAAATAVTLSTAALAQPAGRGFWSDGPGAMMGSGMMMGPGMMRGWGRSDLRNFCHPGAAGFSEWQYDRIIRAVQPNDAQKKALDEVRAASAKAAEKIASTCPAEFPVGATARLGFMEKRMESMLEAIRAVRPAFDAFYASLDAGQKAKLDGIDSRRGWHRWR